MLVMGCAAEPLGVRGGPDSGPGGVSFDGTAAVKPSAPQPIQLSEQGTGEVVACSAPAACQWRLTGTATGSPFDKPVAVVVQIQTAGSWDADGCQPVSSGEVRFFRREGHPNSVGWLKQLSGSYCTHTGGHSTTVTFTAQPEQQGGRYKSVTGAGTMTFTDNVGNEPGNTGFWSASESGTIQF